jgi:hypothetical protein
MRAQLYVSKERLLSYGRQGGDGSEGSREAEQERERERDEAQGDERDESHEGA